MDYIQVWFKLTQNSDGISAVKSPDPRTLPVPVLYIYHETETNRYSVTVWAEIKEESEAGSIGLQSMIEAIAYYLLWNDYRLLL